MNHGRGRKEDVSSCGIMKKDYSIPSKSRKPIQRSHKSSSVNLADYIAKTYNLHIIGNDTIYSFSSSLPGRVIFTLYHSLIFAYLSLLLFYIPLFYLCISAHCDYILD